MVSPALSLHLCKICSPTTAKLYCRNSDFAFLRRQEQSYMCNFNIMRDKELKVEQIEKKTTNSLSIWNLPSHNSSWNKQYYCYRECFKLRCGRAQSTQSTEARQHLLRLYILLQSEAAVSFPDSYRNESQPLQVTPLSPAFWWLSLQSLHFD